MLSRSKSAIEPPRPGGTTTKVAAGPAAFEAAVLEGAEQFNAMIASTLIAYPAR